MCEQHSILDPSVLSHAESISEIPLSRLWKDLSDNKAYDKLYDTFWLCRQLESRECNPAPIDSADYSLVCPRSHGGGSKCSSSHTAHGLGVGYGRWTRPSRIDRPRWTVGRHNGSWCSVVMYARTPLPQAVSRTAPAMLYKKLSYRRETALSATHVFLGSLTDREQHWTLHLLYSYITD